jgi:hypothetical protein
LFLIDRLVGKHLVSAARMCPTAKAAIRAKFTLPLSFMACSGYLTLLGR